MSQIIAVKTRNGVILAADGKAVDIDSSGQLVELEVNRLIQLTPYTAVLAGGAAEGTYMCQNLREFIQQEGLRTIDEVYGAALPFLATEYERFMRNSCERLPLDPVHHVHFIIAGYTDQDSSNPYRLHLLWTKKKLPHLDGDEITSAFAVPRLLRLEYRLNQFYKENKPLHEIIPEVRTTLEQLAANQEEISGPFSFATITDKGFEKVG